MYELQILPFWNNWKIFTRSLRPSDSLPPVSPPFWRHIGESDFFILANCISWDHISDLWTGIFSLGSLIVCFPSLQLGPPPVCNFGFVTFRHLDFSHVGGLWSCWSIAAPAISAYTCHLSKKIDVAIKSLAACHAIPESRADLRVELSGSDEVDNTCL